MRTLADVKRRAVVGASLVLVLCAAALRGHKYLGVQRMVDIAQTNAIRFEGGSWLEWPKAADVRVCPNGFHICEDGKSVLYYEFVEGVKE